MLNRQRALGGNALERGDQLQGIFSAARAIPHTTISHQIVDTRFSWNYTSYLNIVSLVVAAGLYWLYRNRERLDDSPDSGRYQACVRGVASLASALIPSSLGPCIET